ncbi:MAG: 30S ribosomal protein S6 [Alphaproteobacteria bacterium]|nr:MAG: 30S ribosomal protein S6 [Alphaproteobacteria bacterium]
MAFYETVFLARPDIAAAQVEQIGNFCADIITKNGGKVVSREYWGLRNLAYRMNKNRKAHYIMLNIEAPGPAVIELERNLRIHEDVMRYQSIKVDALETGPSVVMRAKNNEGREEFGDDEDRFDFAAGDSN